MGVRDILRDILYLPATACLPACLTATACLTACPLALAVFLYLPATACLSALPAACPPCYCLLPALLLPADCYCLHANVLLPLPVDVPCRAARWQAAWTP